jgi:hypothetical protein
LIDTSTVIPTKGLTREKFRRSKRIQKLKKTAQDMRCNGIWDIVISKLRPGQITLTGDGIPVVYFKARRGLFWYEVTEARVPFSCLLKEGQTVSLPDIIKVISYVKRNSLK